jgi:hypothetical protein
LRRYLLKYVQSAALFFVFLYPELAVKLVTKSDQCEAIAPNIIIIFIMYFYLHKNLKLLNLHPTLHIRLQKYIIDTCRIV